MISNIIEILLRVAKPRHMAVIGGKWLYHMFCIADRADGARRVH